VAASADSSISVGAGVRHFGEESVNSRQQTSWQIVFAFCRLLLADLSHSNEFILRAEVAGERRADVQVNQIHRRPIKSLTRAPHYDKKPTAAGRKPQVEIGGQHHPSRVRQSQRRKSPERRPS